MKKYLVIGNPINHSLSPKLQNWWLKENNINATYDKIKFEDHEIKNFIQTIKEQKIAGCNVTVPFKKTVIPFLYAKPLLGLIWASHPLGSSICRPVFTNVLSSGFKRIEFSSFVSPKAIPQLADADEVIKGVDRDNNVTFTALVPNLRGAIRALESQVNEIVVFLSASESHNQKNLKMERTSLHHQLTNLQK